MSTETKRDPEAKAADPTTTLPALIASANQQLQDFQQTGAHFLCPLTITDVPPGCRPVVVYTSIDPDPRKKEVYSKFGGDDDDGSNDGRNDGNRQVELSGVGLRKISNMIGISWPDEKCRRLDDGRNPNYREYRMVAVRRDYNGKEVEYPGDYAIDIEVLAEEFREKYTQKAEMFERWIAGNDENKKKKVPYGFQLARRENSVKDWIKDCVRRDVLQKRKHLLPLAQTGAMLRAIRSKGFRQTYTVDELKRPFVDVRFERDQTDEERRTEAQRASDALYGKGSSVHRREAHIHEMDEQTIEGTAHQVHDDERQDPTPAESRRLDFQAAEPSQQAIILKDLIKQKGYAGKITGDIVKWSASDRLSFYNRLVSMPDKPKPAGSDELPFDDK